MGEIAYLSTFYFSLAIPELLFQGGQIWGWNPFRRSPDSTTAGIETSAIPGGSWRVDGDIPQIAFFLWESHESILGGFSSLFLHIVLKCNKQVQFTLFTWITFRIIVYMLGTRFQSGRVRSLLLFLLLSCCWVRSQIFTRSVTIVNLLWSLVTNFNRTIN